MSGQRSFDASRLFGRRRERGEPRRAASEDQRKRDRGSAAELDNEKTIDERSKCSIPFLCTCDVQFCSSESSQKDIRLLSGHCHQVARRAEWHISS